MLTNAIAQPCDSTFYFSSNITRAGTLATLALYNEVALTPKPGLVDRSNPGAHRDMDFHTFIDSINAISPWFDEFYHSGYRHRKHSLCTLLRTIRPAGIACEQSMLSATQGVNTHKGAIFSLGLICAVIGYLEGRQLPLTARSICHSVAEACHGLLNELTTAGTPDTAGKRLYRQYGFTGACGEAASGFATVWQYSLPAYQHCKASGCDEQTALLQALMLLMAYNNDTNIVARGGLDGLQFVQQRARAILQSPDKLVAEDLSLLIDFNQQLTEKYLSPGGSADLLAVTWFLTHYDR
ncbi:MAG: 2-(5''-triphosphoribosyl)-3'-dephosphocoenzyme-A synthase [Candidatus Erwinia impunctatus]|nr:2-(5''-triphosphoribosyl)-3'-dephosphocoenzyme-A synthase [Culicoides impunctatus]